MSPAPDAPPARVAIIGAGFSGVMVAANLVRLRGAATSAPRTPLEVILFDRTGRTGRGPAYGTEGPLHLLNVPASRMGAWPEAPGDFHAWLAGAGHAFTPADFVPRRLYARYLDAIWSEALGAAPAAGVTLRVEPAEVTEVGRSSDAAGFGVISRVGTLQAHAVVLCTGHLEPAPPARADVSTRRGRIITNPWAGAAGEAASGGADSEDTRPALHAVRPGEHIVIVGTGLTMLDVVLSLAHGPTKWGDDPRGTITCVSRHGLMPMPHREDPLSPAPPHCTLAAHAAPRELATPRAALRWVRRTIASIPAHADGTAHWTHVIDALRPHTHAAWGAWTVPQRAQFVRHLRALWDVHRHRVHAGVLERVDTLRRAGRLRVRAARVETWVESPDRPDGAPAVEVTLRGRGASNAAEILRCDRLILCTGPNPDIARSLDPLMRSLLRQGLLQRDELGLGARCEPGPTGRVITASADPAPMFAVGPLRRADLWESIAVPELRMQAAETARAVLAATAESNALGS